jgi:hypothetical protein
MAEAMAATARNLAREDKPEMGDGRERRRERDYGHEREALTAHASPALSEPIRRELLAADKPLPQRYFDPQEWLSRLSHPAGLVLIYANPDAQTLLLVRLGSHSELGFCRMPELAAVRVVGQAANAGSTRISVTGQRKGRARGCRQLRPWTPRRSLPPRC